MVMREQIEATEIQSVLLFRKKVENSKVGESLINHSHLVVAEYLGGTCALTTQVLRGWSAETARATSGRVLLARVQRLAERLFG